MATAIGILGGAAITAVLANRWFRLGWREALSLERLGTVLPACGYGAAIIWASDKAKARTLLAWAAPIGRMAFTHYLMQSVIFDWVFYGYGLRLFGVAATLAIGTTIYVVQVIFSAYWLQGYMAMASRDVWSVAAVSTRLKAKDWHVLCTWRPQSCCELAP